MESKYTALNMISMESMSAAGSSDSIAKHSANNNRRSQFKPTSSGSPNIKISATGSASKLATKPAAKVTSTPAPKPAAKLPSTPAPKPAAKLPSTPAPKPTVRLASTPALKPAVKLASKPASKVVSKSAAHPDVRVAWKESYKEVLGSKETAERALNEASNLVSKQSLNPALKETLQAASKKTLQAASKKTLKSALNEDSMKLFNPTSKPASNEALNSALASNKAANDASNEASNEASSEPTNEASNEASGSASMRTPPKSILKSKTLSSKQKRVQFTPEALIEIPKVPKSTNPFKNFLASVRKTHCEETSSINDEHELKEFAENVWNEMSDHERAKYINMARTEQIKRFNSTKYRREYNFKYCTKTGNWLFDDDFQQKRHDNLNLILAHEAHQKAGIWFDSIQQCNNIKTDDDLFEREFMRSVWSPKLRRYP